MMKLPCHEPQEYQVRQLMEQAIFQGADEERDTSPDSKVMLRRIYYVFTMYLLCNLLYPDSAL